MKIIHKLIIGFLTIALMIWLTGYFSITLTQKALKRYFVDSTSIFAEGLLDSMDRNVQGKIEILQEFASNKLLRQTVIQSNQKFEKISNIQSYISEKDREWTSLANGDISPFMKNIMNNRLSEALREKMRFFEKSHGYRVFGEIFITNIHGVNIAQTGRTSDYMQADEKWWQEAKRDGFTIQDIAHDSSAGMYSLGMGIQINDEKGNFIGVIKSVLNIEELISIVKNRKPEDIHNKHKYMHIHLITRDGKLIFSTKENEKFFADAPHLLPKGGHLSPSPGHGRTSNHYQRGTHDKHTELLVTHTNSSGYGPYSGLGWILRMEHDKKEILAPLSPLRSNLILISLAVTGLAILMGISLSAYVTKSFKRLRDYTAKVGGGDLDAKLEISSQDEIGQLARVFTQMTRDLKTTTVARDELAEEMEKRAMAEHMIEDSEERFRSVAENASDGIIYIDSRGEIIFWNHSSERIFGYSAEDVVGRDVSKIMPERYRDRHTSGVARLIQSWGTTISGKTVELYGLRKDGSEFPLELSVSDWNIREDQYFTAIIRDITDRKRTQELINNQIGRLSALRSIDRAIIGSLDMNVTLDVFLTQVISQLGIDAASVLLLNKKTHMLEHVISKGFRSSALKYTQLRLGESNAGRAAMERRIVTIPNLKDYMDGFAHSKLFAGEKFISYIAVPLMAKGRVQGVMELFHRSLLHNDPDWL